MKKCYFSEGSNRASYPSSAYKGALLLPKPSSRSAPPLLGDGKALCPPPSSSSSSSSDPRVAAALRTHSLAEKKRRERINTHLATLRSMIPNANKMDKASLLAGVIEQVRDLKQKAVHISSTSAVPAEVNQVIVECEAGSRSSISSCLDQNVYIRATLCCNDRPGLITDLAQVFQMLRLTAVRAELTSLGGRAHNVFTLCRKGGFGSVCMNSLMESIRQVLAKFASPEEATYTDLSGKRQRLLPTNCSNMTL